MGLGHRTPTERLWVYWPIYVTTRGSNPGEGDNSPRPSIQFHLARVHVYGCCVYFIDAKLILITDQKLEPVDAEMKVLSACNPELSKSPPLKPGEGLNTGF